MLVGLEPVARQLGNAVLGGGWVVLGDEFLLRRESVCCRCRRGFIDELVLREERGFQLLVDAVALMRAIDDVRLR